MTNVSFLILSTRPHGLCSDPTSFSSLSTPTHSPIKSYTTIHSANDADLSAEDGVLNLAGEFVHNFYHTVVGKDFADAVHLYKESATVSRGIEATRATPSAVRHDQSFRIAKLKAVESQNRAQKSRYFSIELKIAIFKPLCFSIQNL